MTKLARSKYDDLAAFYRKGFSMRETAERFGISLERVRQILRAHYPDLIGPRYVGAKKSPAERLELRQ